MAISRAQLVKELEPGLLPFLDGVLGMTMNTQKSMKQNLQTERLKKK